MEPLHVLVWGSVADGPCHYFRGHLFDKPLAALGVELRSISRLEQDAGHVDTSPLDWADVLMFRRFYGTSYQCARGCDFRTHDVAEAAKHPHGIKMAGPNVPAVDAITGLVWDAVETSDKPVVYDADDDLLSPAPRWNGLWPDMDAAQPLVRRMVKRADLVTVSTPVLAQRFGRLNPRVRVVRNAIDASLYVATTPRPEGKARVVYYGNSGRLRDLVGYPDVSGRWRGGYPLAALRDHRQSAHTVFLGSESGPVPGFDETLPFVKGIPEFARALGNTHGDIGLAPVFGDSFDQAKSELHWLEYTASGMATIASRFNGGPDAGPYNQIRHMQDGILARGRAEWSDGLRLLLDPSRREDIAGRARQRIAAEYSHIERAESWADSFRWAAEHRGVGLRAA
jgi:hypothetical protein